MRFEARPRAAEEVRVEKKQSTPQVNWPDTMRGVISHVSLARSECDDIVGPSSMYELRDSDRKYPGERPITPDLPNLVHELAGVFMVALEALSEVDREEALGAMYEMRDQVESRAFADAE